MPGKGRRSRFGRPPKMRIVSGDPSGKGFTPVFQPARELGASRGTPVLMSADEYEAYRLTEYLGLSQEDAANRMGISRGTLWRILESAKKKLATMMVEGRALQIMPGDRALLPTGGRCPRCGSELVRDSSGNWRCPRCGPIAVPREMGG